MLGSDKHFLNSPSTLVVDSLKGLCAANPNLKLDVENKGRCLGFWLPVLHPLDPLRWTVLYQAYPDKNKVALICGGGSGHEPAHAGFVGAS